VALGGIACLTAVVKDIHVIIIEVKKLFYLTSTASPTVVEFQENMKLIAGILHTANTICRFIIHRKQKMTIQ